MEKQYVDLGKGNKISYVAYGNGENAVIFFHGIIGGGYFNDQWIKAIDNKNITLIAIERPGYGSSSQVIMNNISDFINIAKAIDKTLKFSSYDLIGCSAGAPYVYATAYALGDKVSKAYIIGGVPAVYEWSIFNEYSDVAQTEYKSFLIDELGDIQNKYLKYIIDLAKKFQDSNLLYIQKTLSEIIKQDCFGMAQESRLQITNWQIPFDELEQKYVYYHSVVDEMVPFSGMKKMQELISNTSLVEVSKEDGPDHISANEYSFLSILNTME